MPVYGEVLKDRFIGFLMWESILSSGAFLLFRTLYLPLVHDSHHSASSAFLAILTFLIFVVSNLMFSAALHSATFPQPFATSSPSEIIFALLRLVFFVPSQVDSVTSQTFRSRFSVTFLLVSFVVVTSVSGMISMASITSCALWKVMVRGFLAGIIYSIVHLYKQRWVLAFPVIQRPFFFSFKLGVFPAISKSFKLANATYLLSALFLYFVKEEPSREALFRKIFEQLVQYFGIFVVLLCWELSHHLHQVLHTRRVVFAPPKGSAAAETNPSEPLLAALEDSPPGSLMHCLAYLDLCMVCENNVYAWRRAAFFEETAETYKRVVANCLRPLEQLIANVIEGLDCSNAEKGSPISNQMLLPSDSVLFSNIHLFDSFQQCLWGARAVASLTSSSRAEDRFGTAQLSGSNALVISTLISCLLAVETITGKKTTLHPPNQFMGPAGIKWAAAANGGVISRAQKPRSGVILAKAYTMADVLRASIYCVVFSFHQEMLASSKSGVLEKDWIFSGKHLFGSSEALLQKLHLFIDYKAC